MAADDDFIDTIGIYLLPRQVHQSEIFKERAQGLAFAKASDIVEPRVKDSPTTSERLKATTRLGGSLKNRHPETILGQNVATFQSAQSASYDDDASLHLDYSDSILSFHSWKNAGPTGSNSPSSVVNN